MKGLMIDIDDVLADTAKYWMQLFQVEYGNPENLSVDQMYLKYHSVQKVPYWQSTDISNWVYRFINSSHFQLKLPLIKNSNTILWELTDHIPITCYLTKRPERVRIGTEHWLAKHNFPPAEIIFRPNKIRAEDGNAWKAKMIDKLSDKLVAVVDDDKRLIKILEQYLSIHFFLYSFPSYDIIDLRVYPCDSWETLLLKFKKIFKIEE